MNAAEYIGIGVFLLVGLVLLALVVADYRAERREGRR